MTGAKASKKQSGIWPGPANERVVSFAVFLEEGTSSEWQQQEQGTYTYRTLLGMEEQEQGNADDCQSDPGGPTLFYIFILHKEPLCMV
jgi:hypothetical protein